jgi:hypothetical protein
MSAVKTAVASAPGNDRIRQSRLAWIADTLPLPLYLARQAALAPIAALANRLNGTQR